MATKTESKRVKMKFKATTALPGLNVQSQILETGSEIEVEPEVAAAGGALVYLDGDDVVADDEQRGIDSEGEDLGFFGGGHR